MFLLAAALIGASATNPLLGTWIGQRLRPSHIDVASETTMTITRQAIRFGSGHREIGVAPISGFERDDGTLAVRTRFGDVYRFRFSDADHICRVPDIASVAPMPSQCFSRGKA